MQGNDLAAFEGRTYVAVKFEGVLMRSEIVELPKPSLSKPKRGLLKRIFRSDEEVTAEPVNASTNIVKTWRVNERPLKHVIHMIQQWGYGVEVWSYLPQEYQEDIEHWLARKGAQTQVRCFDSFEDLYEEMRLDRSIHTYFTNDRDEAWMIGPRATLVSEDGLVIGL